MVPVRVDDGLHFFDGGGRMLVPDRLDAPGDTLLEVEGFGLLMLGVRWCREDDRLSAERLPACQRFDSGHLRVILRHLVMAVGKALKCSSCNFAAETWDEGRPYFRGQDGRRRYFYHPAESLPYKWLADDLGPRWPGLPHLLRRRDSS